MRIFIKFQWLCRFTTPVHHPHLLGPEPQDMKIVDARNGEAQHATRRVRDSGGLHDPILLAVVDEDWGSDPLKCAAHNPSDLLTGRLASKLADEYQTFGKAAGISFEKGVSTALDEWMENEGPLFYKAMMKRRKNTAAERIRVVS
ncbi:MAG: hypothetical protein WBG23_16445 [Acidobacteriaceae bacterium]